MRRGPAREPKVLVYHGFGHRTAAEDPHNLFVAPEDFERQIRLLLKAFRPIDLPRYVAGWRSGTWPSRSVLITIDDGYESVLSQAAPLLTRYHVPAVVFVPTARLAGTSSWMPKMSGERLLDPHELVELQRFGIDVGVHGMNHVPLEGLPEETLRVEIDEARAGLGSILGKDLESFAYPEGRFDAASVRAVERAGFSVAFAVHSSGGRFTIGRVPIDRLDSISSFIVKLLPGYQRMYMATHGMRRLRRLAATVSGQRNP